MLDVWWNIAVLAMLHIIKPHMFIVSPTTGDG